MGVPLRNDGKVRQKVLANLGLLSPVMVDNLKVALQAAREGKQVVLAEPGDEEGAGEGESPSRG